MSALPKKFTPWTRRPSNTSHDPAWHPAGPRTTAGHHAVCRITVCQISAASGTPAAAFLWDASGVFCRLNRFALPAYNRRAPCFQDAGKDQTGHTSSDGMIGNVLVRGLTVGFPAEAIDAHEHGSPFCIRRSGAANYS